MERRFVREAKGYQLYEVEGASSSGMMQAEYSIVDEWGNEVCEPSDEIGVDGERTSSWKYACLRWKILTEEDIRAEEAGEEADATVAEELEESKEED